MKMILLTLLLGVLMLQSPSGPIEDPIEKVVYHPEDMRVSYLDN